MDSRESFNEILHRVGLTDKHTRHSYGAQYDAWFQPFRDQSIRVVEIGVALFGGGSLLALAEYFPNAEIVGVDVDLANIVAQVRAHPRISLIQADAYNAAAMAELIPPCDIAIDDCVHDPDKQLQLAEILRSKVTRFLVIEDVRIGEFWSPENLRKLWSLGYCHTLIDASHEACWDNALIRLDPVARDWESIDGWFSRQDADEYGKLLRTCETEMVVEIGSYKGRSAVFAAGVLKEQCCKLLCVDPWKSTDKAVYGSDSDATSARSAFDVNTAAYADRVIPCPMPSREAARAIRACGGQVGLVFVDGCHKYESVKADIQSWLPAIRSGGIICGHDYHHQDGVKQAVDELLPGASTQGSIWSYRLPV